jgi:tight adherence protein B
MIAALLLAAALAPQEPPVFETTADAVLLDVFVTRDGEPLAGLSTSDFEVTEGGRRREIELVSPGDVPLAAMLVFDTSASVAGAKLENLRTASNAFLSGLGPRDGALLLTFSHGVHLKAPLTPDRDAVRRALASVVAGGRTSLHDALFMALLLSPRLPGRAVVVAFTDGEDTTSWLGAQSVLQAARESDTLVYAVGAGASALRAITAVTGGRFLEDDGAGLAPAFLRVQRELRTRYLLRFTPGDGKPGWRSIRVRLRRGEGDVRARPGYWLSAPVKEPVARR